MTEVSLFERIGKSIPGVQLMYNFLKKRRYRYLYETIKLYQCKRIMEIGLWDGAHALKMIKTARHFHGDKVEYYGFDLFEDMNKETYASEASKYPLSRERIQKKLERTGCQIKLYKGNTQQTLPQLVPTLPKMDLIFIDGGHSLETIACDWRYSQPLMHDQTVVLFDDYWNRDDLGCKSIIKDLDRHKYQVEILPIQDRFNKDWGLLTINIAKVSLR